MIDLYTSQTSNGRKVPILLEELGVPYHIISIDLEKNEQKSPEFLKINPNGKIPAIVDHNNGGFAVIESGAILLYLAEEYGRFIPTDPKARSEAIQWLMFQMGGIGPMMGQLSHFTLYADMKVPYAIKRYKDETERLFTVLDIRLRHRVYLAGEYSIADIAHYPWINKYPQLNIFMDAYPNLKRWFGLVGRRPAVQRGMNIPADTPPTLKSKELSTWEEELSEEQWTEVVDNSDTFDLSIDVRR